MLDSVCLPRPPQVPQMALPLVLRFFAERDIGLLLDGELVDILEGTLFEPRGFLAKRNVCEVMHVPVAAEEAERVLGTPYGVLINELRFLPGGVLRPLHTMLLCAVTKCVGGVDSAISRVLLLLVRVTFSVLDVYYECCAGEGPVMLPTPIPCDTPRSRHGYRRRLARRCAAAASLPTRARPLRQHDIVAAG